METGHTFGRYGTLYGCCNEVQDPVDVSLTFCPPKKTQKITKMNTLDFNSRYLCAGRLTFSQAVVKKYPHAFIMGEQGIDTDSVLTGGLPWMGMQAGVW